MQTINFRGVCVTCSVCRSQTILRRLYYDSHSLIHSYSPSWPTQNAFCKIQIFKFRNSALPVFYFSFSLSHTEIWLLWCLISPILQIYSSFRFVLQNTVSQIYSLPRKKMGNNFTLWLTTSTSQFSHFVDTKTEGILQLGHRQPIKQNSN